MLRSRSPLGPYEQKIVLHQGNTRVNGPHQGAWVTTPQGKDWFFHFQDDGVYGRILHLQPMTWCADWPFIGQEQNGDGIGEPVESWPLPLPGVNAPYALAADDDFAHGLGIQWQWQGNPQKEWYTAENGTLTLPILPCARGESLLWYMPNVLTQLPQSRAFTMRTTVTLHAAAIGDEAGIAVMGHEYSALALHRGAQGYELILYRGSVTRQTAEGIAEEAPVLHLPLAGESAALCLHFVDGGTVQYAYTVNGQEIPLPGRFAAAKSSWSGAKPALFARNTANTPGGNGCFGAVRFEQG